MKNLKPLFKEAIRSRAFIALWSVLLAEIIFLVVVAVVYIHSSQLQVPFRYSAFSETQYFRTQWFYLFNFVGFGVVALIFNSLISLKLLEKKGRHIALIFLWLSIGIFAVSILLMTAVLRVAGIQ